MPQLISLSGVEPVTAAEARLAARFDGEELDAYIEGAITAAREQAEHITGRCYRPQVRRAEFASFAEAEAGRIAVHQATACTLRYWSAGAWTALDSAAYVFVPDRTGTLLAPALDTNWPTPDPRAAGPLVQVDLTAGPEAPVDVPAAVKLYIKAMVAAWLDTPAAQRVSQQLPANPLAERLLDRERLWA